MEQYSYLNILHNIMFSNVHMIQKLLFKHEYFQTFNITNAGDGIK